MKTIKTIKILTFAALAVTLLFQTPTTHARDKGKAVPPSNSFVVLLEGTYEPAGVVPDLGLDPPHLNNGRYQTVPIYHIDSGVPSPNDEAFGAFYVLGGEGLCAYDLRKGALTAKFAPSDGVVIPDGEGGTYFIGTVELDILEATGIYRSFVGGHIHMVDRLEYSASDDNLIEHCFCHYSRKNGKL